MAKKRKKKKAKPARSVVGSVFRWTVMIACGALCGVLMLFGAATLFKVDLLTMFLSSAVDVAAIVGDRVPELSTPFGKIQIRTKKTLRGTDVRLRCKECRLQHELLADQALEVPSVNVEGMLKTDTFKGVAEIAGIKIPLGAKWDDATAEGTFTLPQVPIAKLYDLVQSIVPEYSKAKISGTIAGEGSVSWPDLFLLFHPTLKGFTVDGLVDQKKYSQGKISYPGKDADGDEVEITAGEGAPNWVPISQIGEMLPDAVLAIEDRGFYSHPGFDPGSAAEAAEDNLKAGKVKRGGSTLTQQLAKNLFLTDERTYSRKLRELLYAVEIDRELGKRRVLELYLNIVEWGPGIYGAGKASATYFKKPPNQLAPEEAAWLASVLRSPKKAYQQQFKRKRPQMKLVEWVMHRMKQVNESERDQALARGIHFAE